MGSRFLKKSILRPLIEKKEIQGRYQFVESLNDNFVVRQEIIDELKKVYDLERIVGRVSFGNANAKDLVNLKKSLLAIPKIKENLVKLNNCFKHS
jgi:DNA mismatch repair protein MutS